MITVAYGKCKKCGKKCVAEFQTNNEASKFIPTIDIKKRLCQTCQSELKSEIFKASEKAESEFMKG